MALCKVTYYPPGICLEGLKNNHKYFSQDSWYLGQNLNRRTLECEAVTCILHVLCRV